MGIDKQAPSRPQDLVLGLPGPPRPKDKPGRPADTRDQSGRPAGQKSGFDRYLESPRLDGDRPAKGSRGWPMPSGERTSDRNTVEDHPKAGQSRSNAASDKPEPADRAREAARRILDLAQGKDAPVWLSESVRKQLERIANGPEPGQPFEVPSAKGPIPITEQQAKALEVVRGLAEATAALRAESHDSKDRLEIISYIRGGQGRHGDATAFDIAAYGGHRFNERDPAESRKAVDALLKDLPPGTYGLGLPRLPTKYPIPEDPQHFKQFFDDVSKFPERYEKLPKTQEFNPTIRWGTNDSKYAFSTVGPSEELRRAQDPHFRQPSTADEAKDLRKTPQLDESTRAAIQAQKERGVTVKPFPDQFGHAHLSVVEPDAKRY